MQIIYFKGKLKQFIQQNYIAFFLLLIIFILGIFFGTLSLKTLSNVQKSELASYLSSFFRGFHLKDISTLSLIKTSFLNNLKTIGLIWLFGLTVIGAPLILLIVFTKGFTLGFTVGFLVEQYSYKGLVFTLLTIVPHSLLAIPIIFYISIISFDLAKKLVRQRFGHYPVHLGNLIAMNIIGFAISGIILLVAGLIEAYCAPFFISLLARIM